MLLVLSGTTACAGRARTDGRCGGDCASGGATQSSGGQSAAPGGTSATGGAAASGGAGASGGLGGATQQAPDCDVRLPSAEQQYALWPMPTHPGLGLPYPASYLASSDGTVLDEVTGLMWPAEHSPTSLTITQAIDLCENLELGGHCDWRVPSRVEVASLMDPEESSPVGALLFDGRYLGTGWGINNSLWAAGTKGIFLELKDGEDDGVGWARCVRVHSPPRVKSHSFSIQGQGDDQVVYDAATDLSWKYADPVVELPQAEAGPYCQSITAAGGGFRLASVKELMTIFDEARPETEHIDPTFFPLQIKYWDKIAWTTPLDVEKASWLFNFTIRSSYQLAGQVSVSPYDERLVFCVK